MIEKNLIIGNKIISKDSSSYVIAEMSGNHNLEFARAKDIIYAAKEAGADAIKLQTYTADTITIDCNKKEFLTQKGGLWEGMTLYELYKKAYTPWEWHEELREYAGKLGIDFFSTPFDLTAVDFLEELNIPAYKIASFEINDIPLIEKAAKLGKPMIMSTGIADLCDIDLAVNTCRKVGNDNIVLLKCISAYPAPYEDMNLRVIPNMMDTFDCIVGLSDHSLGSEIAIAAVTLGARVIEKHFILNRADDGVDSAFSMDKKEFASMVRQIRNVEDALGKVTYELNDKQKASKNDSRSLYVVCDIKKGELITENNVKSIRPGYGMHTKYWKEIIGKRAKKDLDKGTPMSWDVIE